MNLWTILPVKSLHQTKSRLGNILSPKERAELTLHLLARTLSLLPLVPLLRETAVITPDPDVAKLSTSFGCRWLAEPSGSGLNGAVATGMALAAQKGASHCLVLPSDLPFLTSVELAEFVHLVGTNNLTQPTLYLCSDRVQQGTNGMILPTGTGFQFGYGRDSFQNHQHEAVRQGLACHIVDLPSLQFDLDTVEDFAFYTHNRYVTAS